MLAALVAAVALAAAPAAGGDWPMFGYDAARSNSGPADTGITAATLGRLRRQRVQLPGTADSSPIYLRGVQVGGAPHDVFVLTTSYGRTVAVDADSGAILWTYTPPGYDSWAGSAQITNSSPAADPGREFVYSGSPDGRIQKLALADGHAVWRTAITLRPGREKLGTALAVSSGRVIATTGGYYGDAQPYQGHVAILDAAGGRLLRVWNSLCSDRHELIEPASCKPSDSAIWGRAGAVVDPASGSILLATGNGPWDGQTNWGDSTLRLSGDGSRLLGNWTPVNQSELESHDTDLGSSSPVLLGSGYVAQGGKDGKIRLLRLATLNGSASPGRRRGGELQTVATPSGGGLFTAPAVRHANGRTWMFAADGGGTAAWLLRGGRLHRVWRNGNEGTSPVVAGGLLYVYGPGGGLRVYVPAGGRLLATLDAGGGHWSSPIVSDGRIALPEGSANDHREAGILDIWRLS